MTRLSRSDSPRVGRNGALRKRALHVKAIVFALIGLVNTAVDYSVFLLARAALAASPAALAAMGSFAGFCRCGTATALALVLPNLISWTIAVSGSYVLNSSITFAAESGGRLRLSAYAAFVLTGVFGLLANTATLLIAAEVFLLPVWLAKAFSILAAFVVNFSLSHFVVFRARD